MVLSLPYTVSRTHVETQGRALNVVQFTNLLFMSLPRRHGV